MRIASKLYSELLGLSTAGWSTPENHFLLPLNCLVRGNAQSGYFSLQGCDSNELDLLLSHNYLSTHML
jgi:hypothetical protein